MSISLGTRLGSYEILALIGAGGMGQVYRARDLRLGRDLAVKILPPELAIDASRRQRFESEARVVAALNHPNIVAIYDVGSADGLAFIVSELVEGETLRGVLKRGPVPVRKAMDIAVQIADGLAAAHSAGIVHRDLKPENIMLTPQGRVKILDFGLAKSIRGAAQDDTTQTIGPTQLGSIVGTVAYMSPEQAAGRGDLDGRSDQFALGLILHEVVSGKKAFEGRTAAELMTAIIREDPAPLPTGLPTPFRWTIQRCLAKEPGQRYAATLDLFLELRQLFEHASEVTPLSESDLDPAKSRKISRLVPAVLASGGIAGFIAAALWLEAPLTPVSYVPFATEAGIQTMPAWSPAGDRIAYSAEVEGVFQIFTRKLNSPTPAQLTLQDASCFRPFWTPDGTRVYYIVSHEEPDFSLWSIGVAGGAAEKVLDGVAQAALSPNGQTRPSPQSSPVVIMP
jgi:serine/threonine protein kinase